jgi:probable HAF family extracellular repeat protein
VWQRNGELTRGECAILFRENAMKTILRTTVCFLLLNAVHADALRYKVTDLGTLGGTRTLPTAINSSGHVVGSSSILNNTTDHAFLYKDGVMTDLGTLAGGVSSTANGINDNDVVVGTSTIGGGNSHAFHWSNGTMTDAGTSGTGVQSQGAGINNDGHYAGTTDTVMDTTRRAFLFATSMMTIPTLGGTNGTGNAINSSDQVAGEAYFAGDVIRHAFRYTPGAGVADLGTLGGPDSFGNAINDAGHVVGGSDTANGEFHACIAKAETMVDLGVLSGTVSEAFGINNSGQIVGQTDANNGSTNHAFVHSNGVMLDLNDLVTPIPGLVLTSAKAINDAGQIVCEAILNNAMNFTGYLLTPETVRTPTVKISGKKKTVTGEAKITIKGTTRGETDSVTIRVGRSAGKVASGTARWKFKARLKPGKNVITATATGYGGTSAPAKITVFRK